MSGRELVSEMQLLLRLLDEAYSRKTWHGANLKGSLRGLTARKAAWRPGPKRHNIWELAVHAAYWKYAGLRHLSRGKDIRFALEGSNWFPRPEGSPGEAAWKADLRLLGDVHQELRRAVAALSDRDLERVPEGRKTRTIDIVLGLARHDIYHAGQIQLLKRLHRSGQ